VPEEKEHGRLCRIYKKGRQRLLIKYGKQRLESKVHNGPRRLIQVKVATLNIIFVEGP
jgi:hypothetical protein